MQWTPEGWVAKDNSHKVTTMMRPLPKLQIVPPLSTTVSYLETNLILSNLELTALKSFLQVVLRFQKCLIQFDQV